MTQTDNPHVETPAALAEIATEVADLAAQFVRSSLGQGRATHTKSSPTDVVTEADVATELLIREALASRSPGSSIVGEELDDTTGTSDVGWIIDPIDGTVNYLYDLPVVSVSIAATVGGTIVAGAVADVVRHETFAASIGAGAQCDGQRISVGRSENLATALVGTGFSYDAQVRLQQSEVIARVLPAARDIRCFGSAALNLCWVANGRLDVYFERGLKPYDYAAGALIATEAGAVIDSPRDSPSALLLACNPSLRAPVRFLITD